MIHQIFTVHDSKAEAYLPPFYLPARGAALRSFSDTANDASHAFNQHPGDYTLFALGTYDDSSSSFDLLPTPLNLGLALDFINQDKSS